MSRFARVSVFAVFVLGSTPAFAMPQFLQMFRSDPFRNPAFDGCNTCHMSAEGGDERNTFGQAFERGGERITTMLRAQFPDHFIYPMSKVSDTLTIHYSDPANKQIVVESGAAKNLVDVEKRTLNDVAATLPSAPAAPAAAAAAAGSANPERAQIPVDPYAREGVFFGSSVVNLPNGKPQKAGGWEFFVAHRFNQSVGDAGLTSLFGFDSTANIEFGVRYGVTDRLSVSAFRTNFAQTISLGSAFQISRQSGEMPVTLQARGAVDGKFNFGIFHECNPATVPRTDPLCGQHSRPRQYSPVFQLVATRTFKDRVSFNIVPTYAWNTRDDSTNDNIPGIGFGFENNDTFSLGIGTGIRILPTVSVVGEVIPRVWGFRGRLIDRTPISIGLQKSTFRHTFELVVSNQQVLTPAEVAFQGVGTFRLGFNIYRKIR
jgi:hypothetical protein